MTDEHAMKVAKVIANAIGDNFSDAFKNKQRWTAKRGMSGGRFRDVNEPFQDDYIAAAKAAAAVIAADRAGLVARIAELEAEVERLAVTVSAAEQRASQSEHRLHSFRRSRASTSKALSEFIKARAPELWPDYAAVSVNKSVYTDDYTQEPTWEREMNILLYRAEKAEEELAAARAALGASYDA